MKSLPSELINEIAAHCEQLTDLNSLTRTHSDINEAVNGYPKQVLDFIQQHQPKKLALQLLKMVDPISLITFEIQVDKELNFDHFDQIENVSARYNYFLNRSSIQLSFKLGTKVIFSHQTRFEDVAENINIEELTNARKSGFLQLGCDCAIGRKDCDNGNGFLNIRSGSTQRQEISSSIIFKPKLFEQIIDDLTHICVQYQKFLN